jgi:DNA polymerase-3 subunit delta'
MAFKDFSEQQQGVQLLQRSLGRRRLAHGYLFTGHQLELLENLARTLVKTLHCLEPVKRGSVAIDCCDRCLECRKIEHATHPDVYWVRPESKSRVITIDQMREVIREMHLKPKEGAYKIAIIVAVDCLLVEAAYAFLKTLEEPPPGSVLMLLTTDRQQVLETILSRCLRLNFAGEGLGPVDPNQMEWLLSFSGMAAQQQKSLLGRYRLLDVLLQKLNAMKAKLEETLTARSPLERFKDVDKNISEKWEAELAASIEAEYRRQRFDLLALMEWWLRDVWLLTLSKGQGRSQALETSETSRIKEPSALVEAVGDESPETSGNLELVDLLSFPQMPGVRQVAQRISSWQAKENLEIIEQLQRRLNTNIQEALALEVGMLKLNL